MSNEKKGNLEAFADELIPYKQSPYSLIKFRKYNEKDSYENQALQSISRVIYEVFGNDVFSKFTENLEVSRHFLHSGTNKKDLSVFFKSIDFGGSGGTFYYILALKLKNNDCFTYGLSFDTSEAGKILLTDTNTESGYKIISVKDRSSTTEYACVDGYYGYILNPAE